MLNTQFAYPSTFTGLASRPETGRPAVAEPAEIAEAQEHPSQPPVQEEKLSPQATRKVVEELNEAIRQINTGLEFSQDEETGWTVVKVIDRETKETLRQFPSEEALAIAHSLDRMKGLLLQQTA